MRIDSHCHAWERWPYQPPVPDDESRGRIEQLLNEMDLNEVDKAVLICAQIDHNPENNAYIAREAERHADRIIQFVDLDSSWSDTYHQPGATKRLREMADQWPIKGFTHYLKSEDDGSWLFSDEGLELFAFAAERKLIASIAGTPNHQPSIRKVAERFPSVPILCHHLAGVRVSNETPHRELNEVLASASVPNIFIKFSGFAYCSQVEWEYPYSDTMWIVRTLYEHFGPHRMCWGSDYPVVRFYMTYRQSVQVLQTHCAFIPEADKQLIFGDTLARLLDSGQVS